MKTQTWLMLGIVLSVHSFLVYVVHACGSHFYKKENCCDVPRVYDVGWKYLPDLHENRVVAYMVDFVAYILPFLLGADVALEYVRYILVILLIRGICINVTILPRHESCDDSQFHIKDMFMGHCYDKIFSGHFASFALLCLILYQRGYVPALWMYGACFVYGLLIIALRYHYTIDVIVAGFVAVLVFQNKVMIPI